jgi:hypothetical protein
MAATLESETFKDKPESSDHVSPLGPRTEPLRSKAKPLSGKKIDLTLNQSYCKYNYCKGLVEYRRSSGIDK